MQVDETTLAESILRPLNTWRKDAVRIGDADYSRSDIDRYPHAAQNLYKHAYDNHWQAQCLCQGLRNPVPMHLALRDGSYMLRRNPKTAGLHAALCESSNDAFNALAAAYGANAVTEDKQGGIKLSLVQPLSESVIPKQRETNPVQGTATARAARAAVTQHGLLGYLWQESKNNVWRGGEAHSRSWSKARAALRETLQTIRVSTTNASSLVFLPSAITGATEELRVRIRLRNERGLHSHYSALAQHYGADKHAVVMVLAPFKAIEEDQGRSVMRLAHLDGIPFIEGKEPVLRSTKRMFGKVLRAVAENEGRTSAIALVAAVKNSDGLFELRSCTLMQITQQYLPFNTHYEQELINALVASNRGFTKPCVNAKAANEPSVIVHNEHTELEVHVIDGTEEERFVQQQNISERQERFWGRDCLVWDVTESDAVPLIP